MSDRPTTIGALVAELRADRERGVPCERLRALGIASPAAMLADLTARGCRLEFTGGAMR